MAEDKQQNVYCRKTACIRTIVGDRSVQRAVITKIGLKFLFPVPTTLEIANFFEIQKIANISYVITT